MRAQSVNIIAGEEGPDSGDLTLDGRLRKVPVDGGGSITLHYIFFASIEVVCSLVIIWLAWTWRDRQVQP